MLGVAFFDFEYTAFQAPPNSVLAEKVSIAFFALMKEVLTFGHS